MKETIDEHWDYINKRREFVKFERRDFECKKQYSKEKYLGLLNTFSPHMSMEASKRKEFFKEIELIIEDFDNQVLKHYKTVLLLATKT
ncbi:MAG: hypothetical protein AAF960_09230 [Bacteroidota bacterium]